MSAETPAPSGQTRGESLADWGELRFLEWVEANARGADRPEIVLGIGDDAAILRAPAGRDLTITTDALIEGTHFDLSWAAPDARARKALISNLSDLAAMASGPVAAFLSLGVPPQTPVARLQEFFLALSDEAARWGCAIAGGDLTRAPQWTINLTLIGALYKPGVAARRDAGRAGDALYVTGWPGESAAGLDALMSNLSAPELAERHLRPTPRFNEIRAIAESLGEGGRLCAIDVSDGIWNDAGHLSRRSRVGIEIELDRLPVSNRLRDYASARGIDPLRWVLYGGEDYELLILSAEPEDRLRETLSLAGVMTPITRIGRAVEGSDVQLISGGQPVQMENQTFRHF